MWERSRPATGGDGLVAVGGPSADAEITADGKWNDDYVASKHYWNPWLGCGSALTATGSCYADLVKAIVNRRDENVKAKAASHMSHYLADAICSKHADMIELDIDDLTELTTKANLWFAEHDNNPRMKLTTWLASTRVTEALALIVKASRSSLGSPYWRRAERPRGKDLVRFYSFFGPFYYSGQLVMTYTDYMPVENYLIVPEEGRQAELNLIQLPLVSAQGRLTASRFRTR